MAVQYVILSTSDVGNRVSGYAHSLTSGLGSGPNNAANYAWADAVRDWVIEASKTVDGGPGSTKSQVPPAILPSGRQADLDNGSRYEWPFNFEVNANLPPAPKLVKVEEQLVAREVKELAALENRLNFWGKTGTAG